MAKEIFPSSYECDCGHQSHFFTSTVRELKRMSVRKRVRLADEEGHTVIFHRGDAIEIICPKAGTCRIEYDAP